MERIESLQNQRLKDVVALSAKSSLRRSQGLCVVEGRREVERCVAKGFDIDTVFVCRDIYGDGQLSDSLPADTCIEVSRNVYDRMAYRGGTEGIIAIVRTRMLTLDDLALSDHPLLVVLESVEKPGNLGAVLRSADASGADAMIVCDPLTDLYNPNLIRSSVGGIFSVQCVACSSEECINFLKSHQIQILTAQLQDSELYYNTDMSRGTAIVMGTESTGLTQIWRDAADAHIRIPMLGQLDSLNVSVSASILLYEAVRQRQQG